MHKNRNWIAQNIVFAEHKVERYNVGVDTTGYCFQIGMIKRFKNTSTHDVELVNG